MLIGKLGSQRGLRVIQDSKSYLEAKPRESLAVLGKLGRKDAEAKLIDASLHEKEGRQEQRLSDLIG